ncbi:MAG: hypothetical protein HYZ53_09275 [Planctomycetes bacterium]|nr:hypothetical protein [Planctomycetota bacterium]
MQLRRWALGLTAGILGTVGFAAREADAFFYKFEQIQLIETANADGAVTTVTVWDNLLGTVKSKALGGKEKSFKFTQFQVNQWTQKFRAAGFTDMDGQVFSAATTDPKGSQQDIVFYDPNDFYSWYYGSWVTTASNADEPAKVKGCKALLANVKNYVLASGAVAPALDAKAVATVSNGKVSCTNYIWNQTSDKVTLTWTSYPQFDWVCYNQSAQVAFKWSTGKTFPSGKPKNMTLYPNSYARFTTTWDKPPAGAYYSDAFLLSKPEGHARTTFAVPTSSN